jgi:hypothetical protein
VFQTPPAAKINFENTTHKLETPEVAHVLLFSPKSRQYAPLPKTQRQSEWVGPLDHAVFVSPKIQYSRRGFRIYTLTKNHHSVGVDLRWAIGADSFEVDSAKPL